jgi:hypothetical protein
MSATLAGIQIYDYNTFTEHLVVTVHQYLTSIYSVVKTLITEHRSIHIDPIYSSTKHINID